MTPGLRTSFPPLLGMYRGRQSGGRRAGWKGRMKGLSKVGYHTIPADTVTAKTESHGQCACLLLFTVLVWRSGQGHHVFFRHKLCTCCSIRRLFSLRSHASLQRGRNCIGVSQFVLRALRGRLQSEFVCTITPKPAVSGFRKSGCAKSGHVL
jgi:hypothetical protein